MSYLWPRGLTHTHTHIHTQTLWRNESEFKKTGVRWPATGARLVLKMFKICLYEQR